MGLQDANWDGYFDEEKDSIMESWYRCDICKRIPSEIFCGSYIGLMPVYNCRKCKIKDYKPRTWWQKFNVWLDKKI